jgi:3-hydroxyisobutyrate dehydrogenase-like beta-hydroxyacid dehydrogenase
MYSLNDYLHLRRSAARKQWRSIEARQVAVGRCQDGFLPVETLLCLAAGRLVNHRHYGASTSHLADEPVPTLARLFRRPESSILAKMASLDGSRSHGARFEVDVASYLRAKELEFMALYRLILAAARDVGVTEQRLPDFLQQEAVATGFDRADGRERRPGTTTVGVVHPGAMGAVVGAAAAGNGARVCWASTGRSDATRGRAEAAGLEDLGDLATLASEVDILLSVCPPAAAVDVATQVAATGFAGIYVDANAIAPATTLRVQSIVGGRARVVDGGIVGPPPRRERTTRLYLSGADAARVAALFDGTALSTVVLDGPPGRASALKACYATYTKGTSALLAAIRALARHHGVEEALLDEWTLSIPALVEQGTTGPRRSAPKAWRFIAEMEEHATTFRDAGLPDGVPAAAAEIYRRLASFKDVADPPLDEVLAALAEPGAQE